MTTVLVLVGWYLMTGLLMYGMLWLGDHHQSYVWWKVLLLGGFVAAAGIVCLLAELATDVVGLMRDYFQGRRWQYRASRLRKIRRGILLAHMVDHETSDEQLTRIFAAGLGLRAPGRTAFTRTVGWRDS